MAFIYDLTDTWNASGTTFNAIKMNVTDSASAAASKLVTLQVGGSERFGVRKDGQGYFAGNVGIGTTSPGSKFSVVGNIATQADSGGAFQLSYTSANANSRSWRMRNDVNAFGDFAIQQSTTQTGSTYADRMLIANNGNVGIGTSSPGAKLHVVGNTYVQSGTVFTDTLSAFSTSLTLNAGNFLAALTGATERMRIDSTGNVGIGTSSPVARLDVRGEAVFEAAGAGRITLAQSGGVNSFLSTTPGFAEWRQLNTEGSVLVFSSGLVGNHAERMRIDSSGQVGIGTSSPATLLDVSQSANAAVIGRVNNSNAGASADARLLVSNGTTQSGMIMRGTGHASANHLVLFQNSTTAPITLFTNGAERMRIDSSGNVGIGTSAPATKLEVSDGSYRNQLTIHRPVGTGGTPMGALAFAGNNTSAAKVNYALIEAISTAATAGAETGNLCFNTASAGVLGERMRIDSSGNFMVGTTTAAGTGGLTVQPLASAGAPSVVFNRTARTDTSTVMQFRNGGSNVGTISYTDTAVAYNTSSDARLKENIAPADDAAALIDAIQVRKFDWKIDGSHQRYGMVAQELLEVAPEAVSGEPEGEEMMGVDYSKLVPMLIKEVQSLRARVAQLEGN